MIIVNVRSAQNRATHLGITTKTLERNYGVIIVKDDKINKMNWNNADDDELFYWIQDFMTDHPEYRPFLCRFGIDEYTKIRAALGVGQIANVFQHTFDARLSFEDKDRPENTEGYTIRTERGCLVAIASSREWDDGCERSQSATVIHEYGHYAEQRIIPDDLYRPDQPYSDRETSFASALLMLCDLNPCIDSNIQRLIADELVAWVNTIWISWIVGLDPRTAILGAVLDSADQNSYLPQEIVERVFTPLAIMACSKKHANEYFRRFGPYDLSSKSTHNRGEMGDKVLCLQIDQATRHAFNTIKLHEMVL